MKKVFYLLSLFTTFCHASHSTVPDTSSLGLSIIQPLQAKSRSSVDSLVYRSENLLIRQLSEHVYVHTSFLDTESFGRVPCNGMVILNEGEAIVFDTPADEESSLELIKYFREKSPATIKAIVATHFHADCVGGLKAFHEHDIPSYAGQRTIELLKAKDMGAQTSLQHSFKDLLVLKAGDKEVYAEYFGEGHTKDNVIGYFPAGKVIFGGCLIKEMRAGKGNLEDANVEAWPETVRKIQQKYPEIAVVIPGHGEPGGSELLDYTINLFK